MRGFQFQLVDRGWLVGDGGLSQGEDVEAEVAAAHAQTAAKLFVAEFGVKRPKAAAKITDDRDVLLAF